MYIINLSGAGRGRSAGAQSLRIWCRSRQRQVSWRSVVACPPAAVTGQLLLAKQTRVTVFFSLSEKIRVSKNIWVCYWTGQMALSGYKKGHFAISPLLKVISLTPTPPAKTGKQSTQYQFPFLLSLWEIESCLGWQTYGLRCIEQCHQRRHPGGGLFLFYISVVITTRRCRGRKIIWIDTIMFRVTLFAFMT
jgi:hypothetical protein